MGDLAFAVVRRQLAIVRDKEPGDAGLGEDPEELHDMRVATRRLRAALSLFAEVFPVRAQVFREELGWMGRLLGAVRDLDVQLEGLSEIATATAGWSAAARPDNHDPLSELSDLIEHERDAARSAMLGALDSVRWERLCRGLTAMAQQGPARRSPPPGFRRRSACPTSWSSATRPWSKRPSGPRSPGSVTDFHRLRIRCKRLRYALEFSSELYGGRTASFVRQLTALQDELGLLQDHEVASIRLADLATGEAHLPRGDRVRDGRRGRTAPARGEPTPAPGAQGTAADSRAGVA